MKKRLGLVLLSIGLTGPRDVSAALQPAKANASLEKDLAVYAERFLPFDPQTRITVEKASETVPGFQSFRIRRTGRYEKLKADRVVYVSNDGKWFFAGDVSPNAAPRPVRVSADLDWVEARLGGLLRTTVRALLVPERDAAGLKGVAISVETGYGPIRIPGYVSADGKAFLQGTLWDFRMDPRAERRRRIDLSVGRAQGRTDAAVQIVEYADMECGYCKFRGQQMDRLLEANVGVVNVRRHYKFFPLWIHHVWAMKAASAADCLFRFKGPAMFRFKEQVYGRQETMTLAGVDELALTVAEAEGVTSADFLSCYLQEESFSRVRREIEEGYRLGVNSTPTYFVDGAEISWLEDKVVEDFLRSIFPKIKSISYESKK